MVIFVREKTFLTKITVRTFSIKIDNLTKGVPQRKKVCLDQNQTWFKKINFSKIFVWKVRERAIKLNHTRKIK